ncbi:DUF2238 domain-containing protein [Candidatus Woesearchaeota archaeon]|nr:DUF2238 domain-containing protein [Candidatus Woesearchaeota archaeon]
MKQKDLLLILGLFVASFLIWSLINPKDYFVWFLEVVPALIGITILAIIYPKFKFTNLIYIFVALHSIILIVGGHYTYAENPLFNWIRDYFGLSRNYYDRLGHLAQGFFPAIILREFLLRKTKLERGKMLFFLVVCMVLALSASYEIFEWLTAITTSPGTGDAFLGTQGDVWDTQWDMFLALIGAIASLLIFSKYHDKLLRRVKTVN